MSRLRALLARLYQATIGDRRRDQDFRDELDGHLQLAVDDNLRAGMTAAEARRAALLQLGGVSAVTEAHRDRRTFPLVDALVRDVRWALGIWRRSPGFTSVAVLSLALGIGANTAIFSIIDALVLRALPAADPGQLVEIQREANRPVLSNPLWEAVRDRHLFQSQGAWSSTSFNLAQGGAVDPAAGLWVSGGFFEMLGVRPALGRLIMAEDDRRTPKPDPDAAQQGQPVPSFMAAPAGQPGAGSASAVAVLSYGFWQRRFGRAPDVVGRSVALEGVPFTIIGVAQQGFFGAEVGQSFDIAVPLAAEGLTRPRTMLDERTAWWLFAFGRLRPDQTIGEATLALRGVQPQIRAETLPDGLRATDEKRYLSAPMALTPAATGFSDLRRIYAEPLAIVMGVVGIVLLIACVNLANLLLARADARRHEMSVRLALGASRRRLIGQLLVESLLLAAAGAILGLVVAEFGSRLLIAQLSTTTHLVSLEAPLDWRVLGFTMTVALVASLVFGLAPAWRATGTTPHDALKSPGRTTTARRSPLGAALVSAQVALSLVLVVGAGLFVRTFAALATADLGFDARSLLVVSIDARRSATPPAGRMAVLARARDAVRALPGVEDAALSSMAPFAGEWDTLIENPDGLSLTEDERDLYLNAVSPEWFATYGVAVREGRGLEAHDATVTPLDAVVINRTAARRFFPSKSAVGQVVKEVRGDNQFRAWHIVGVVDDAVYDSVRSGPPPTMYEPLSPSQAVQAMNLTVRASRTSPEAVARSVVAAIGLADPRLSVRVQALDARVADAMLRERLLAYLSGFFGALALLLAGLGLYGVVSYDMSRRQREIGIRLALGARASSVVAVLGRRVALLVAVGVVIGAGLSYWSAEYVATLLFSLNAHDVTTLAGAVLVLGAVAALAAWVPARRATRLDPTVVLREG